MSTETDNLHRMSAPDPTVAGVAVGGETIFSDESGVFLIPAEHAPTLAGQGWATLPEPEDAPDEPKGAFTEDEVREQLGLPAAAEPVKATRARAKKAAE